MIKIIILVNKSNINILVIKKIINHHTKLKIAVG